MGRRAKKPCGDRQAGANADGCKRRGLPDGSTNGAGTPKKARLDAPADGVAEDGATPKTTRRGELHTAEEPPAAESIPPETPGGMFSAELLSDDAGSLAEAALDDLHLVDPAVGDAADDSATTALTTRWRAHIVRGRSGQENPPETAENALRFGTASAKNMCVAVGQQVFLFDAAAEQIVATFALAEAVPVAAAFSGDGRLLVIADALSTLHFVDAARGTCFLTQDLPRSAESKSLLVSLQFTSALDENDGSQDLLVAHADGTIVRYGPIAASQLVDAVDVGDREMLGKLRAAISGRPVDVGAVGTLSGIAANSGTFSCLAAWGNGPTPLCVQFRHDSPVLVSAAVCGSSQIVKSASCGTQGLLTLDAQGNMALWSCQLVVMVASWAALGVVDFELVHGVNGSLEAVENTAEGSSEKMPEETIHIVARTADNQMLVVRICGRKLQVTHQLQLGSKDALVVAARGCAGPVRLCLVEPVSDGFVLRTIETLSAKAQMAQLLRTQRYVEARELGAAFSLDTAVVTRALLEQAVADLRSGRLFDSADVAGGHAQLSLETLQEMLQQTGDAAFSAQVCCELHLPTLEATRSALEFASSQLGEADSGAVALVFRTLTRLETYQLELLRNSTTFNASEWHTFRQAAPETLLAEAVQTADLSRACTLWRRHYYEMADALRGRVAELLAEMPETAAPAAWAGWLRADVLPSLAKDVEERARVVRWIALRVRQVEASRASARAALNVLRLLGVGETEAGDDAVALQHACTPEQAFANAAAYGASRQQRQKRAADSTTLGAEESLTSLYELLGDLCFLGERLGVSVSLDEYEKQGYGLVALSLLDRAPRGGDPLSRVLENEFVPFLARLGVSADERDELLSGYCHETMDAGARFRLAGEEAPWEARVLAMLPLIGSRDVRLDVTIEALRRRAALPRTADGARILAVGVACSAGSPRLGEFQHLQRLFALREMLSRYNVEQLSMESVLAVRQLVVWVTGHVSDPRALTDALQLVGAHSQLVAPEVYRHRLFALCLHGEILGAKERRERFRGLLLQGCESGESESGELAGEKNELGERLQVGLQVVEWLLERYDAAAAKGEDAARPGALKALENARELLAVVLEAPGDLLVPHETLGSVPCVVVGSGYSRKELDARWRDLGRLGALWRELGVPLTTVAFSRASERRVALEAFRRRLLESRGNISDFSVGQVDANAERPAGRSTKGKRAKRPSEKASKGKQTASKSRTTAAGQPSDNLRPTPGYTDEMMDALQRAAELLGLSEDEFHDALLTDAGRAGDAEAVETLRQCGAGAEALTLTAGALLRHAVGQQPVKAPMGLVKTARAVAQQAVVARGATPGALLTLRVAEALHLLVRGSDQGDFAEAVATWKTQTRRLDVGPRFEEVAQVFDCRDMLERARDLVENSLDGESNVAASSALTLGRHLLQQSNSLPALWLCCLADDLVGGLPADAMLPAAVLDYRTDGVLCAAQVDQLLALAYLVQLPLEHGVRQLGSAFTAAYSDGKHYVRQLRVCEVGLTANAAWGQFGLQRECEEKHACAQWLAHLTLLGVPVDAKRLRDNDRAYAESLVPEFLARTHQDVPLVLDYARSFHLSDDKVLLEFVGQFLARGDEVPPRDVQDVLAGIGLEMTRQLELAEAIERAVRASSPLAYDRLRSLLAQQAQCLEKFAERGGYATESTNAAAARSRVMCERGLVLLDALQTYARTAAEMSGALEMAAAPSDARPLPFHPLYNSLQIDLGETPASVPDALVDALTPRTLTNVLGLCSALNVRPDAVREALCRKLLRSVKNGMAAEAVITSKALRGLLTSLGDVRVALELTTAFAEALPSGSMRAALFALAEALASKLAKRASGLGEAEQLLQLRLVAAAVRATLGAHGLAHLCDEPDNLADIDYTVIVRRLYETLKDHESPTDLHKLAEAVARVAPVNVDAVRRALFDEWLALDLFAGDHDARNAFLPSLRTTTHSLVDPGRERALEKRILYLFAAQPRQDAIAQLHAAFCEKRRDEDVLPNIRAGQLLLQLATPDELANDPQLRFLSRRLPLFLYLLDFQELGLTTSTTVLASGDKEALARSLWMLGGGRGTRSVKILQLICNLCIDGRVLAPALWRGALEQLLDHRAFKYLLGVVEYWLAQSPAAARAVGLDKVWERVLQGCLDLFAANDGADAPNDALASRIVALMRRPPAGASAAALAGAVAEFAANAPPSRRHRAALFALRAAAALHASNRSAGLHCLDLVALKALPEDAIMPLWHAVALDGVLGGDPALTALVAEAYLLGDALIDSLMMAIRDRELYHLFAPAFSDSAVGIVPGAIQPSHCRAYLRAFVAHLVERRDIDHVLLTAVEHGECGLADIAATMYAERWPDERKAAGGSVEEVGVHGALVAHLRKLQLSDASGVDPLRVSRALSAALQSS